MTAPVDPGDLGARVLDAVRTGRLARPARLAAARGALPLAAGTLIEVQLALASDPDGEIAEAARASLAGVSAETALALVTDPDSADHVLAFVASAPDRWPGAAALVASSTRVAPAALVAIAGCAQPDALAALVGNHQALTAVPELAARLQANPAVPDAARIRLLDYVDELDKRARAAQEAAAREARAAEADPLAAFAPAAAPARDPFLAALGVDAEVEALLPELGLDLGQLAERSELLGEAESEEEQSLIARLARMNVGQKLRVALFGDREVRQLLIRDSNRIVAAAVVKNPKFTAREAESAANSRNVNDEVLRLVARHRDFAGMYTIQHALVKNPRCPVDTALAFVAHLNDHDLRLLLKNRNVSDAVRRQGKKIIEARESRRRVRLAPTKH